jgi:hypothetical protein
MKVVKEVNPHAGKQRGVQGLHNFQSPKGSKMQANIIINDLKIAIFNSTSEEGELTTTAWNELLSSWSGNKYYLHNASASTRAAGLEALEVLVLRTIKGEHNRSDSRSRHLSRAIEAGDLQQAAKILASSYRSAAKNHEKNEVAGERIARKAEVENLERGESQEEEEEQHPLAAAIEQGAPLGVIAAKAGAQIVLCGSEFQGQKIKKQSKKGANNANFKPAAYAQAALF